MPELVRCEPRNAQPLTRLVKRASLKNGIAQRSSPPDADKHQIISSLARDMLGEIFEQEARQRHVAPLVALCRPERHHTLDRRHRFGDKRSAAQEIEPVYTQRRHLAPSEAGIGQEQHQQPVILAARLSEIGNLLMA